MKKGKRKFGERDDRSARDTQSVSKRMQLMIQISYSSTLASLRDISGHPELNRRDCNGRLFCTRKLPETVLKISEIFLEIFDPRNDSRGLENFRNHFSRAIRAN